MFIYEPEEFEKKRSSYVEKMKNKMAEIHKSAEEKRAVVVAKKREDLLKVEDVVSRVADGTSVGQELDFSSLHSQLGPLAAILLCIDVAASSSKSTDVSLKLLDQEAIMLQRGPFTRYSNRNLELILSPLGRGFLSGGSNMVASLSKDDFRKHHPRFQAENLEYNNNLFNRVNEIAVKKGCTPSQLALAWVHHQGTYVLNVLLRLAWLQTVMDFQVGE
ncbi:hypothetical protein POM88_050334 [Heracleum sosnowskyi]|uniref:NADP-dependent oxidoreductase domain-containing protein n=1 Tax=Heracleum sosnowskyi TaxID=360622 RepID=A0AAD8M2J6_9APIA|nr:hypothetical protein POM88_050334 [Heracleum sosnowskyi]